MKLNAVSVSAKDIAKSVGFYTMLGFGFPKLKAEDKHAGFADSKHPPTPLKGGLDSLRSSKNSKLPSNPSSFEGGGPQGWRMFRERKNLEFLYFNQL